jgi:ATP-dependent Clp protease ATP-binding subunit ClpA
MAQLERFTDRARKVMALANQHAQRTSSEYIFPEHICCGMLDERDCSASRLLLNAGVRLDDLSKEVETLINPGSKSSTAKYLPETNPAKSVIVNAIEESRALGQGFVGTEHYLLGFLRNPQMPICQLLMRRGIDLEEMRRQVAELNDEWKRGNPLRLRIRALLLSDWDPQGIGSRPEARQAYDAYLDPIIELLRSNANEDAMIEFLKERESEIMCFPSLGAERLRPVARKLLLLR